jgi:hypothetical protein
MAAKNKIVDLRNLLAERFPHFVVPQRPRLITGLSLLDEATSGGLPQGAITELISPYLSNGSGSLIYALLHAAHRDRYFLALIDGRDSFDPKPLGNFRLRHLLWIRCLEAIEAVTAADLLLRDGNFPIVILDLVLNPPEELRRIPQTTWYRLQRLVELAPTAFVVLTRHGTISSAHLKLILESSKSLEDLHREDGVLELKIRLQRIHGSQQIAGIN